VCQHLRLLAVSEDSRVRNLIGNFLEFEGHYALCVQTPDEAITALSRDSRWDCLLIDASKRRDLDAVLASTHVRQISPERLYLLTELGDLSWQANAQRWNICNVLIKPLLRHDLEKLVAQVVAAKCQPNAPPAITREQNPTYHLEELGPHGFFLAASPAMMRVYRDLRILASVDYPVLILGESGVGKEVAARLLHKYHARSQECFINVNTAAIPSELLESELFGYEAGAFTGAVKAKPGKFELADKGTLLLDEIGEMGLQMQAKLLHVLQDGSFSPLGARSSTRTNVRILSATNVDIEAAIAEKRFREDLYYRLNTFTITVPALRDRREEIPILMEEIMRRAAVSIGREPCAFSSRLIEAAQEYHWPGNLRELRNFVARLLVLGYQDSACEDLRARTIAKSFAPNNGIGNKQLPKLPDSGRLGMKGLVNDVKHETERRIIEEALIEYGWNRRRTASNLNISYRSLLYKIQQHNLTAISSSSVTPMERRAVTAGLSEADSVPRHDGLTASAPSACSNPQGHN
jgi:two-component system response regulator AtoC